MNISKIASKIVTAYGFHTYEELKSYLKRHPKADREKHWVETDKGTETKQEKVPKKDQSLFKIPEKVKLDTAEFDVANSAFMKKEDKSLKFYIKGIEVKDEKHINVLTERAKTAHLLNTKLYTNIRLNTEGLDSNKEPDILAIATNPQWKPLKKSHKLQRDNQPCVIIRNVKVMEKAKLKNMINNSEFTRVVPNLHSAIQKGLNEGKPEAAVLFMMTEHGVRPGTLGTKNYGAITITRKHVQDLGDKIVIKNMPMKHKNILNCEITDKRVMAIFRAGIKAGDALPEKDIRKGFVFLPIVGQKQVDEMFTNAVGEAFTPKNIRTYIATKTAKDMMDEFFFSNGIGENMSMEKRFDLRKKICKVVSKLIHNEDSMSYGSYIDHVVLEPLGLDEKWSDVNPYTKEKKTQKKDLATEKRVNELLKKAIKKVTDRAKLRELKAKFKEYLAQSNNERQKAGLTAQNRLTTDLAKKFYEDIKNG